MAILVDQDTRLIVQGVTGHEGEFHCRQMLAYGTRVVAGVVPGRGGQRACDDRVSVFDTVKEAVATTDANASIIYVPAQSATDAILEAADTGIPLIVCITEGIPVHDMIQISAHLVQKQVSLIGPNCPGVLSPGKANVSIIPGHIATPGPVGIVSRSGTLTYTIIHALTSRGIGQSTCVGIGGDPIVGTTFVEVLEMFEEDPATEQVIGDEMAHRMLSRPLRAPWRL